MVLLLLFLEAMAMEFLLDLFLVEVAEEELARDMVLQLQVDVREHKLDVEEGMTMEFLQDLLEEEEELVRGMVLQEVMLEEEEEELAQGTELQEVARVVGMKLHLEALEWEV
jgi:hypothetical protein